jgi:hypothetical protein
MGAFQMGRVAAPGKGRTVLVIQERFAPCLALLVNGQLPLQLAYVTFLFFSVVTVRFYLHIVKVLMSPREKTRFLA